jgi:hypothetical protein
MFASFQSSRGPISHQISFLFQTRWNLWWLIVELQIIVLEDTQEYISYAPKKDIEAQDRHPFDLLVSTFCYIVLHSTPIKHLELSHALCFSLSFHEHRLLLIPSLRTLAKTVHFSSRVVWGIYWNASFCNIISCHWQFIYEDTVYIKAALHFTGLYCVWSNTCFLGMPVLMDIGRSLSDI